MVPLRWVLVLCCLASTRANVTLPLNVPINVSIAAGTSFSAAFAGLVAVVTARAASLNDTEFSWTNGSATCTDQSHVEASVRVRTAATGLPLSAFDLELDLAALPYRTVDRDLVMCHSSAWTTVFSICRADSTTQDTGTSPDGVAQTVCTGTEFASLLRWNAVLECPSGRYDCACTKSGRFIDASGFAVPWTVGSVLFVLGVVLVNTQGFVWGCCEPRVTAPSGPLAFLCTPCAEGTSGSYRTGVALCLVGTVFLVPAYAFALPSGSRRPGSYLACSGAFGGVCVVLALAGLAAAILWRREGRTAVPSSDAATPRQKASGSHSLFDAWRRARLMLVWALLLVLPASNSQAAAVGYWPLYLLGLPGVVLGLWMHRVFIKDVCCIFVCFCSWCCSSHPTRFTDTSGEKDTDNIGTRALHFLLSSIQILVAVTFLVYFGSWPCYDRYMPSTC